MDYDTLIWDTVYRHDDMGDDSIDMVILDIPYGISCHSEQVQ
jgi:hypothetical protein